MNFKLIPLNDEYIAQYKKDMQEAFQKGAEEEFGKTDEIILPERDIDDSLSAKNSAAYMAMLDGEPVSGAVVAVNEDTQHNELLLLYVKYGCQNKGIGQKIWQYIENMYPDTKVWETITPYFEKRNIHFYVNRCGFHIVEFFNKYHPEPDEYYDKNSEFRNNYFDGMFRFEKYMKFGIYFLI